MTETTLLFDILVYNIATPLGIAALSIWIVTDNRRLSLSRMMSKVNEITRDMMR